MNDLIAKRLLALRGSQPREVVAKAVGISLSALQMYETGKRVPRDDIKIRIADYYNKTVQEIFFNNQNHETCDFKLNTA
ncbi:helix-turn-helix transcriptional regulator [Cohnella xylanilytica]|uniref:Helix-turn-helix transcriptional regulator n=1 Tax=Cohnella xylanilytica TaxID=557555 RepID=A0A841TVQ2_9BACL|nr:helix-turn-helix transcriptional regulator [Cohnella xylanilytica]MBB6689950.1 helix-turn-helix transcriptional regulator [Cohnella xylanilytica]